MVCLPRTRLSNRCGSEESSGAFIAASPSGLHLGRSRGGHPAAHTRKEGSACVTRVTSVTVAVLRVFGAKGDAGGYAAGHLLPGA